MGSYTTTTWVDDAAPPISATNLNKIEAGISAAHTELNADDTRLDTIEADLLVLNAQTGTTYTLALTDKSKLVTLSNASAITLTVPPNSSVAFPIGSTVTLAQIGAGQVTVTAGVGVTVNGAPGLKLTDQWSSATLIKRLTDTWLLVGRLST